MNGPEVVDVEVVVGSPDLTGALGVFLYHPNPDGKVDAETVAWSCGAEFTTFPGGPIPREGSGQVEIKGCALYVSLGQMYVISPLTLKGEETAGADRAVVYFTDAPFDPADRNEKTWLAVNLPLVHSSEENA